MNEQLKALPAPTDAESFAAVREVARSFGGSKALREELVKSGFGNCHHSS